MWGYLQPDVSSSLHQRLASTIWLSTSLLSPASVLSILPRSRPRSSWCATEPGPPNRPAGSRPEDK